VMEPGYFDAIWEFLVQEVQDRTSEEKVMNAGDADIDP